MSIFNGKNGKQGQYQDVNRNRMCFNSFKASKLPQTSEIIEMPNDSSRFLACETLRAKKREDASNVIIHGM